MAGAAAALGGLLHVCQLWIADQITIDEAAEVSQRFVHAGLAALDLV
jgi:hypothetical protein